MNGNAPSAVDPCRRSILASVRPNFHRHLPAHITSENIPSSTLSGPLVDIIQNTIPQGRIVMTDTNHASSPALQQQNTAEFQDCTPCRAIGMHTPSAAALLLERTTDRCFFLSRNRFRHIPRSRGLYLHLGPRSTQRTRGGDTEKQKHVWHGQPPRRHNYDSRSHGRPGAV